MTTPDIFSHLAAMVGTGVGLKLIERYTKRDELDASQASATIRKLWRQVEEQATEIKALRVELDRCKDGHRVSQSEADVLRRDVADLREELDELKAALKGARP